MQNSNLPIYVLVGFAGLGWGASQRCESGHILDTKSIEVSKDMSKPVPKSVQTHNVSLICQKNVQSN